MAEGRPRRGGWHGRRWSLPGALAALIVALVWLLAPNGARAEDRITVRGNYYRESSTRVLQPLVSVSVDVPDERLTLGATYLLDAISSASIATGTQVVTGGDNVFTELRHEVTGSVGSRLGDWSLGGFFRYSTETDYISRSLGASVARDVLQRSGTLSFSYALNFDRVFRITNNLGARSPWCGGSRSTGEAFDRCSDEGVGLDTNLRTTNYFALGYTHALHRTVLGGVSVELAHVRGPQDNPYRRSLILNGLPESHPLRRTRVAPSGFLRWRVPKAKMVVEPRYRYYADDWEQQAHAADLRVHFRVLRHLRLRLRYRFYVQTEAFFWRDDGIYFATEGIDCTTDTPQACASADPKMDNWHSHTPGLQLTYELDGLARFKGLGWLEGGWIQATYNQMFQTNRFGTARIGSLAFSLAF